MTPGAEHTATVRASAAPRRARRTLLTAALLTAAGVAPRAHATQALRIGVIPYLGAAAVARVFEPLVTHLGRALDRPVMVYTAPDCRALAEHARGGDYDLAVLPEHLALLAAVDWGQRILARTAGAPVPLQLLVRRDRLDAVPTAWRGLRFAVWDGLSLTALALDRWLRQQRLEAGRDVAVAHLRTVTNVLIGLDRGDFDVAAVARSHLAHLAEAQRARYEVVLTYGHANRLFWTAHRRFDAVRERELREALLAYRTADDPRSSGPAGQLEAATTGDTEAAQPLLAETRRRLAG